jgi:hypothetical protein
MNKKSIIEQALLQIETLEEAVKDNAKGILESTMKKELTNILKEDENLDEEEEDTLGIDEQEDEDMEDEDMEDEDMEDENMEDEDMEDEDMEDEDMEDEDIEDEDMEDEDIEDESMGLDNSDDTLDLTNATDDEVMKIYKKMKPEDGIIVKKVNDDIEIDINDEQYLVKLNESYEMEEEDMYEEEMEDEDMYEEEMEDEDMYEEEMEDEDMYEEEMEDEDMYEEEMEDEDMSDENIYEIELDGDSDLDETTPEEVEMGEAARTFAHGFRKQESSKLFKAGRDNKEAYKNLHEQISKLKKQNSEYKKALGLFKEKLNEIAVFNANLAYSTKLFTENTTTKQEKINILKRFDNINTISESKQLYSTINNELNTRKPMVESVVNKIKQTPKTSSSSQVLNESKVYENPSFARIKDLMNKIK